MQFILGAATMLLFFVALYGAYQLGRRSRIAPVHKEVDDEQRLRAERLREGFQRLMSYDVPTALRGKR